MDTQRLIAELDTERARSQRLELQIGALLEQVTALTQKVAELTERLGQNSRNSHLPPSSDPPGTTGKSGGGQRPKSDRPRGGQRGHRGVRRELVAADKVNEIVDLYPAECENCWAALPEQPDPKAALPVDRGASDPSVHQGDAAPRADLFVLRTQDARGVRRE